MAFRLISCNPVPLTLELAKTHDGMALLIGERPLTPSRVSGYGFRFHAASSAHALRLGGRRFLRGEARVSR